MVLLDVSVSGSPTVHKLIVTSRKAGRTLLGCVSQMRIYVPQDVSNIRGPNLTVSCFLFTV